MEDKCQFCGAEEKPWSSRSEDHCHWVGKYSKDLSNVRSIYCYERQLTALLSQNEAMREARELIRRKMDSGICPICEVILGRGDQRINHREECYVPKLMSLLTSAPAGEWVVVKREDLDALIKGSINDWQKSVDRLKAALGGKTR